MTEQHTKRPWFRVHLSTAIVLMFVAGGLLGLNMRAETSEGSIGGDITHHFTYGWPLDAYFNGFSDIHDRYGKLHSHYSHSIKTYVALDIATALSILFAVWFVLEWWIKRQALRRK